MTAFGPTALLANLRRRAELLAGMREFLTECGYWEVETPLLSHDIGVDAHLEPFAVASAGGMYLQTSPEFGMKRLLAAGSGSIFQVTRSFRHGEVGPLHNPEFTIIEWYRVGGGYRELMNEVGALVADIGGWPAAERITYSDAFREFAGVDPFAATDAKLAERAAAVGFAAANSTRDELLNSLLATLVEPRLGTTKPVFLYDYPPSQAALARVRREPPTVGYSGSPLPAAGEGLGGQVPKSDLSSEAPAVAERFELYYRGIEICNGFQELTDSAELRRRNRIQNQLRQRDGRTTLTPESRLLAAMDAGLPESAGIAFGFDRFVMLTLGASQIAEVMAFPLSVA